MPDPQPDRAAGATTGPATPTPSRRSRESIWRRLADRFWGYDYFISYHWGSGGSYAVALAQRLRDRNYEVFLDRAELAMGDDWKGVGARALRHTQRLVLVATREAVTASKPVEHELFLFTSRGKHVVPIAFAGDPGWGGRHSLDGLDRSKYPALGFLEDSQLHIEDDHANLTRGPSDAVIERLIETHRVMRRRNARALAMGLVAGVLILFSAVSSWSAIRASLAQRSTENALDNEKTQRKHADDQRVRANKERDIAEVRRIAAASDTQRILHPDQALLLAVEAFRKQDRFESRAALYRGLLAQPGLILHKTYPEVELQTAVSSREGPVLIGYHSYKTQGGGVMVCDLDPKSSFETFFFHLDATVFEVQPGADGKAAFIYGSVDRNRSRKDHRILTTSGIVLFDWKNRKQYDELPERPEGYPQNIAFCRRAGSLAVNYLSGEGRENVVLFDVATRKPTGEVYPISEGTVTALKACGDDGSILAVAHLGAGGRSGIILLDLGRKMRVEGTLAVPYGIPLRLDVNADGSILFAGFMGSNKDSGGVLRWDLSSRKQLGPALMVSEGPLTGFAYIPGAVPKLAVAYLERDAALGEGDSLAGVILWDLASGSRIRGSGMRLVPGNYIVDVFSGPQGSVCAAYSLARDSTNIEAAGVMGWDSRYADLPLNLGARSVKVPDADRRGRMPIAYGGPSGKRLAIGSNNGKRGGFVVLYDTTHREYRQRIGEPIKVPGYLESVAFGPDGTLAIGYRIAGEPRNEMLLWDALQGRPSERTLSIPNDARDLWAVYGGRSSPVLAVGYRDTGGRCGILLWDVPSYEPRRAPLELPSMKGAYIANIAMTPDCKTLAAGYAGGVDGGGVSVWDLDGGRRRDLKIPGNALDVTDVAYNRNGKILAVACSNRDGQRGAIHRFDAKDRAEKPHEISSRYPTCLAFSPSDDFLLAYGMSASMGGSSAGVVLFDCAMRQPLGPPIPSPVGQPYAVAFDRDGATLAAASPGNHEVTLWDAIPQAWVNLAPRIVRDNLSRDQWELFFPDEPYRKTFQEHGIPGEPEP